MDGLQPQHVHLSGHDPDVGAPVEHAAGNFGIGFFLQVDVHARIA